jgi:polysaccharide export outer membrane protein
VTGLNLSQAKVAIEEKLDKYFKGAYVSVQLGGIRFSILGEVRAPGKYVVLQNRLTILEALATAGDLTPVANRKKIKILRQLPGEMQVEIIDLTKANLIESPSLYIRPNDVIYVEPLKIRAIGTGVTGTESLTAFATVLSVVSSVLLINNLLR